MNLHQSTPPQQTSGRRSLAFIPSPRALVHLAGATLGGLLLCLAVPATSWAQNMSMAPTRAQAVLPAAAATGGETCAKPGGVQAANSAQTSSTTFTSTNGVSNAGAVAPATEPAAMNMLRVGTVLQFDIRTRTVGDAMNSLLAPVRYRVTQRTVDATLGNSVLRRPLPVAAREAGYMTIEQGLLLLIGEEHRLVVDHRARLVAIERLPANVASR